MESEEKAIEAFLETWSAALPGTVERWWKAVENVERNRIKFASRWATEISIWAEYDRQAAASAGRPSDEDTRAFLLTYRIPALAFSRRLKARRPTAKQAASSNPSASKSIDWDMFPLHLNEVVLSSILAQSYDTALREWLSGRGLSEEAASAGAIAIWSPLSRAASPVITEFIRAQVKRETPEAVARQFHQAGLNKNIVVALLRNWCGFGLQEATEVVVAGGYPRHK